DDLSTFCALLSVLSSVSHRTISLTPSSFFFLLIPPPPRSTLFPYTTLFRSTYIYRIPKELTQGRTITEVYGLSYGQGHTLGNVGDRKSTRLNSSHVSISYAVFCLKKKKKKTN